MRGRRLPAVLLGAAAALALGASAALAQTTATAEWFNAGDELSNAIGRWSFYTTQVPADLVDSGYTYARVTSGSCSSESQELVIYEANLTKDPMGDIGWSGTLMPMTPPAMVIGDQPSPPNIMVISRVLNSTVSAKMVGVPGNTTFTVCFRKP